VAQSQILALRVCDDGLRNNRDRKSQVGDSMALKLSLPKAISMRVRTEKILGRSLGLYDRDNF
jgi:hypothetical protein